MWTGELQEVVLGLNIDQGQRPQLIVPGNFWKASALDLNSPPSKFSANETPFTLISEFVSPEFDFRDHTVATLNLIKQQHPQLVNKVAHLIKPTNNAGANPTH